MYHNRRHVAPYDLIARDFRELDALETLRTTWDNERLILMQSVQGHAHEGHCTFAGRRFPNTTIDDIDLYQIMRAAGQVETLLGLGAHMRYDVPRRRRRATLAGPVKPPGKP